MTGAAVETLRHGDASGSHQLFQDLWSVIRVKAGSDSREKRAAEMEAKENILRAQGAASVGALLRFHQWNAVLKLEADAGGNAVGHSS